MIVSIFFLKKYTIITYIYNIFYSELYIRVAKVIYIFLWLNTTLFYHVRILSFHC